MQFIDLGAQRARIENRLNAAISKVVAEGRYILGPEVAEFEKKLGEYLGVEHVIACANGTDALQMPLMTRGIGPGHAVLFRPSPLQRPLRLLRSSVQSRYSLMSIQIATT